MNSDTKMRGRALGPAGLAPGKILSTSPQQPDDEGGRALDLGQILRAVWRGKWLILLLATIGALIAGYYAFKVAEPRYASTARLTFQVREQPNLNIESVVSGVSTEQASINTELQVLRSRKLLMRVVERLKLDENPEFNPWLEPAPKYSLDTLRTSLRNLITGEKPDTSAPDAAGQTLAATRALAAAVSVAALRNTYIFDIRATTGDPRVSTQIANTLADVYLDEQIEVKFSATEHAVTWLSERVDSLEKELRQKEDDIKHLRSDTELISVETLDALRIRAKELRDRISDAETELTTLLAKNRETADVIASGDIQAISAHFNDPSLRRLANGLTGPEDDAWPAFQSRIDALRTRSQTLIDRAKSQKAALEDSYALSLKQIEEQNVDLVRLNQLEREADATRVLYESFLARLKEASVQVGLQQADSRVLSEAIKGVYVSPKKSRIIMIGITLGLLLGAAVIVVRELIHDGFRNTDELERAIHLPVLGQIPKFPIRKRSDLLDFLKNKPTSAASEAIRNLRTSVLLSNIDNPPQVILLSSSVPGEGKTTMSISLAQNLSGLDKRVLLIEADIRRRTFQQYFQDSPKGGLVSAVVGATSIEDSVLRDPTIGVDILMGEKSTVNAADLFSSERFRDFMAQARSYYDTIIIDTPPVLVVPDARVIGQHADAVVYVVKWDSTNALQVQDGLRQLSSIGLPVAGLALSQIDPKGMKRYGYGGRYGAYAGYGHRYYNA